MFLTKSSRKKTSVMFLNFFQNAMIKNIKIQNIIDIIEISKYMEPNKIVDLNDFSNFNAFKKIKV